MLGEQRYPARRQPERVLIRWPQVKVAQISHSQRFGSAAPPVSAARSPGTGTL